MHVFALNQAAVANISKIKYTNFLIIYCSTRQENYNFKTKLENHLDKLFRIWFREIKLETMLFSFNGLQIFWCLL